MKILKPMLILLLLSFFICQVYAVPALPHAFHGTFIIDGNVGNTACMICTEVAGGIIPSDCITTETEGVYGDNRALIAQDSYSGALIRFRIGYVYADQNAVYTPGDVQELNLTFTGADCSISSCGNGAIDGGDLCDGSDLGGQTCVSKGFASGTLSCNSNCTTNTSSCVAASTGNNTGNGSSHNGSGSLGSSGSSGGTGPTGGNTITSEDSNVPVQNIEQENQETPTPTIDANENQEQPQTNEDSNQEQEITPDTKGNATAVVVGIIGAVIITIIALILLKIIRF